MIKRIRKAYDKQNKESVPYEDKIKSLMLGFLHKGRVRGLRILTGNKLGKLVLTVETSQISLTPLLVQPALFSGGKNCYLRIKK